MSVPEAARQLGVVPRSLRAVAARNNWTRPVRDWHQAARVMCRSNRGTPKERSRNYKTIGIVLRHLAEGYPLRTACGMAGIGRHLWESYRNGANGNPGLQIPGLAEAEQLALAHSAKRDIDRILAAPDWNAHLRVAQLRDPETFGAPGGAGAPAGAQAPIALQINVGELRPRPMQPGSLREQLAAGEQLTVEVGSAQAAQEPSAERP